MNLKGFKIVDSLYQGHEGFQFSIGQTYEQDTIPKAGVQGFHFCRKLSSCIDFFGGDDPEKHYLAVEAYGDIDESPDGEYATNKIKIIKELSWREVKDQLFKEIVCC